ncbi:MAG TPA: fluoride efflux transporter CrcB [Methylophilaceae bacterium]|nr:fluoride efflux transporter CrcB [Methylophilaceae bacterium]
MGFYAFVAIFVGAGLGALLRWGLGNLLNPVFPTLPLGTLAANLIGGLLIGALAALFSHNSALPPEARLFAITGFMGGLTTFSTFSLEVVTLFSRSEYFWAMATVSLHLLGSLLLTAAGIMLMQFLLGRF